MGLLQKLKSVLGLNGTESSESGPSGDVDVTVEREPSTEDEDAVKGTDTAGTGGQTSDSEAAASESADAGVEAPSADEFEAEPDAVETDEAEADAVETDETEADEGETDETEADEIDAAEAADEAEPEETAPEPEEAATDTEAAPPTEPEPDSETAAAEPDAEAATEAAETVEGSTDPVTELNGIGPAYGDRLAGVGIDTVGELAAADPAEVADQIDLGESRVAGWVEQANEY